MKKRVNSFYEVLVSVKDAKYGKIVVHIVFLQCSNMKGILAIKT